MTDNHILVSDTGAIRTITFNRPNKMNALTFAMYATIADAMVGADKDPKIRAIVFRGHEGCFSAGNDMVDFQQSTNGLGDPRGGLTPVQRFLIALIDTKTPLIAIVDGLAVGVAVTMLLHCDFVYCSKHATFQTPFTSLGLCPEAGSSQIMPAIMGRQQASELLMLSKKLTAKDAFRLGFVTRIFKRKKLYAKADENVQTLVALPPSAVRLSKSLMLRPAEDIRDRMEYESTQFSARLSSEEFTEAAAAFLSRRKPDFSKFE
ncbi:MAG: enoyl-CoA hydratase [Robiginitomaculum sp.]|nr:MAG: enoyl-CoA hydratase [Robiginitomaculum sp.]